MGFLGRIRGGDAQRTDRLAFSELGGFVDVQESRLREDEGQSAKMYGEILKVCDSLTKKLDKLSGAGMQKDVQRRIGSMVEDSRDNYVSKIRSLVKKIGREENALSISEKLTWALSEITEIDFKYGERSNFGYPNETKEVKKELNRLVGLANELNSRLAGRKAALAAVEKAKECARSITVLNEELKGLLQRKVEIGRDIAVLTARKDDLERSIDSIKRSERAEQAGRVRAEIARYEDKKAELENFTLNVVGPLKRVFKKYAHAVAEGKASGIGFERYAEDPVGTYLKGDQTLPDLLAKSQIAIQSGVLDLEGDEGERALKKIRAISFSFLDKARGEYMETVSHIRHLERRLDELNISREVERIQTEIESVHNEAESLMKEGDSSDDIAEEKRRDIERKKRELLDALEALLGQRTEIVWDLE